MNIKTWGDRLEGLDDGHLTTNSDIRIAMQSEIDELRAALKAQPVQPALTDEQIKEHGDKASHMMARDQTRFDAACEVMKYLKEIHAPYYYMHRMSTVLHGNTEGTPASRAPDSKPQPVQPAPLTISSLEEQQLFDDWCPYKGNPDPRVVWAAAVDAVNGVLLGVRTGGAG